MARALALLIFLTLPACAALPPPPPVMPVLPDRSTVLVSFGRTCIPVKATTTSPEAGPVLVRQTWEGDYGNNAVPGIFDPRLAIGELFSPFVGMAVTASWSQMGVDIRVFPRRLETPWPVLLSVGAQVDGLGNMARLGGTAWNLRLGVGLLPRLSERTHLMIGTSAGHGAWRFRLALPQTLVRNQTDNFMGGVLQIVDKETRVEGLLGIAFPVVWRWRAFVTLEPFAVVNHGGFAGECSFCAKDLIVTSFQASWGLAFQFGWVM